MKKNTSDLLVSLNNIKKQCVAILSFIYTTSDILWYFPNHSDSSIDNIKIASTFDLI